MIINRYAVHIRQLRKQHNLTQKDLADGICSQALISKIESGAIIPDIETIHHIANKFNITVSQLIGESSLDNPLISSIEQLLDHREYAALEQLLSARNLLTTHIDQLSPYYLWLNAIILHHVHHDFEESLLTLDKAYALLKSNKITTREEIDLAVRILNSHISILDKLGRLEETQTYYHLIKQYPKERIGFETYTISRTTESIIQAKQGIFTEAILIAQQNIDNIIEHNSLLLLDDNYLQLANVYTALDDFQNALHYITLANTIATIKMNRQLLPYIEMIRTKILANSQPNSD